MLTKECILEEPNNVDKPKERKTSKTYYEMYWKDNKKKQEEIYKIPVIQIVKCWRENVWLQPNKPQHEQLYN